MTGEDAESKFLAGWAHHQKGEVGPAWGLYQQAIALDPRHFNALHLAGIIAAQAHFLDQAADLIGRALDVDPNNAPAHFNRGNALADLGQHQAAISHYDRAIALDGAAAVEPLNNRANALWALKQYDAAIASLDRAIALKPDYAQAHNNRGNVLRDKREPAAAVESFDRAIALRADFAEAHNNRGNALRDLGRTEAALESYDRALRVNPGFAMAHNNRGNALRDLKRPAEAVAAYDVAIALQPDYVDAYVNRGAAQRLLKAFDAASHSYTKALALAPQRAEIYNGLGLVHADLKQFDAAVAAYDRAIQLNPDYAEAHNNRGVALNDLKMHAAALDAFDRAIAIRPDYPEVYNNRGMTLKDLGRQDAALASYDAAIKLKPESAEAYNNRGILLTETRRLEEAITSYERALALNPSYAFVMGSLLNTKMQICDWGDFDANLAALVRQIESGAQASSPFSVLALVDSPSAHRKAAEIWTKAEYPRNSAMGPVPRRQAHEKLRIGYFSMDFRHHPVALLMAGLLEAHDRKKFETFAFSYGPDTGDAVRQRVQRSVDRFIDVRNKSDRDVAALSRELQIDIAVDLAGYTVNARPGIFALGAASLQVNYLGYPGTMGADYYDYLIADCTVIPAGDEHHYAEKIVRLPHCYQVNDTLRPLADTTPARADLGLPETGFVLCCFNNNFKITPAVFESWVRILKRVPGSVLWLLEDNALAARNLRKEAEALDVDAARLVFAARAPHAAHLARHGAADLFLDTLPYNAHTTASDALWCGLPVLTRLGESLPARVAASNLRTLDLAELITATQAHFEDRAVELASNPAALKAIREKLARNRLTQPLFNAKLFAGYIEAAYSKMYFRAGAGLAPDHIDIAD